MEKSVNFLSIVAKIKWSPSTSRKSTKILANRPFWLKIWIRSRGKNYTFLNPVNSWNSTLDFNGNSTGILRIRKKEKKPKNLLLFLKWFIYDGGEASQLTLWVKSHQILYFNLYLFLCTFQCGNYIKWEVVGHRHSKSNLDFEP